ncbi:V-type ATP synthase subunit E [Patescibacteria group bacterium]
MALTDILEEIEKEVVAHIKKLKKEYEEKKTNLEKEHKENLKKVDEDLHNQVETNSKKILEKAENLANMETKNELLKAKKVLIDEYLDKAIDKLTNSADYENIITQLLKQTDFTEENVVVIPAKGKEDVTKNAIKNADKKYFLSDKSGDIKGGFIIKTDKIEIDNSFSTILFSQLGENLEMKLNKILF